MSVLCKFCHTGIFHSGIFRDKYQTGAAGYHFVEIGRFRHGSVPHVMRGTDNYLKGIWYFGNLKIADIDPILIRK
jgi:hypothetical protein